MYSLYGLKLDRAAEEPAIVFQAIIDGDTHCTSLLEESNLSALLVNLSRLKTLSSSEVNTALARQFVQRTLRFIEQRMHAHLTRILPRLLYE